MRKVRRNNFLREILERAYLWMETRSRTVLFALGNSLGVNIQRGVVSPLGRVHATPCPQGTLACSYPLLLHSGARTA